MSSWLIGKQWVYCIYQMAMLNVCSGLSGFGKQSYVLQPYEVALDDILFTNLFWTRIELLLICQSRY